MLLHSQCSDGQGIWYELAGSRLNAIEQCAVDVEYTPAAIASRVCDAGALRSLVGLKSAATDVPVPVAVPDV